MTPKERDLLILRYLDETASADEVAQLEEILRADVEARKAVRDLAEQAVELSDLAWERLSNSSKQSSDNLERPRQRHLRTGWLTAASIVLVVAGITIWRATVSQTVVTIAQSEGTVSFAPPGGEYRILQDVGERVPAGSFKVEGAASSVALSFVDGSTITLVGDAELVVSAGKQKLLTLNEGSLLADVQPQQPGCPMVIRTPTAEAVVLGTQFILTAEKARTKLSVDSGSVQFKRRTDGSTIDVTQGKETVADLGSARKMESHSFQIQDSFGRTFEKKPEPPDSWRGNWLEPDATAPGRMLGIEDLSSRRADGTPVAAYIVRTNPNPAGFVNVTPQSVLRLRLRTAKPHFVLALLGLRYPGKGWAGNFQKAIEYQDGARDEAGWQTVEIPLSSMKGTLPTLPSSSRVHLIYLASYSPKANLEVAEVSITTPRSDKPKP